VARIRTIKPDFFTSDDICALSPHARLLYIGLWCEADREGRLQWSPNAFKRRYLPDDKCDIDKVCLELRSRELVVVYGESGEFAYIPTFLDHQKPNPREAQSTLPDPDLHASNLDLHASNPDLLAQGGKEGKGKEGKGREDARASMSDSEHEEVLNAYAEFVMTAQEMNWPTPRNLDPDRKVKLRARLSEHGVDGWRQMLAEAKASEWLSREFKLRLDWVLEPRNFRKVIEGNYRNGAAEEPPRKVVGWN